MIHHHGEVHVGQGRHHPAPQNLDMGVAPAHENEFATRLFARTRSGGGGIHRPDHSLIRPPKPTRIPPSYSSARSHPVPLAN